MMAKPPEGFIDLRPLDESNILFRVKDISFCFLRAGENAELPQRDYVFVMCKSRKRRKPAYQIPIANFIYELCEGKWDDKPILVAVLHPKDWQYMKSFAHDFFRKHNIKRVK